MQFGFLGISYQNARLEIRDKISFTDAMKLDFFQKAEAVGIQQCMVLSTCNRSEIYYIYIEEKQKAEKELTWQPTWRPSTVLARASELLAGQAGRQVPGGDRSARHAPARRLAASLARLTPWIGLSLSPEPPRHPLSSPAPLPRSPTPWPTPSPPPPRRSHALRQPHAVPPCPGAPPPSTSSS